jgi:hypothetical protein
VITEIKAEFKGFHQGPEYDTETNESYSLRHEGDFIQGSCSRTFFLVSDDVHSTNYLVELKLKVRWEDFKSAPFVAHKCETLNDFLVLASGFSESQWHDCFDSLINQSSNWSLDSNEKFQTRILNTNMDQVVERTQATNSRKLSQVGTILEFETYDHIEADLGKETVLDEHDYDERTTDASNLNTLLSLTKCSSVFALLNELSNDEFRSWDSIAEWMKANS